MRKQLLALACVAGLALIIQSAGCGGGSVSNRISGPTTSLVVSGGDVPLCNILAFNATITGMTLTPQNSGVSQGSGNSPISILSSENAVTLDFASLMDFSTILSLAKIPAGTYSQVNVTLANPTITYLDTTKTPPVIGTLTPTLSALTVPITFATPLTVSGGAAALSVDLNLLQSVLIDPLTGQLTGEVHPTFSAVGLTTPGTNGFVQFDDLHGIVQNVATTSANSAYSGSFTIQPATGPLLTVEVTSSTKFDGVSGLSALTAGTFVEVNAIADLNGNIVANEIAAEETQDAAQGQAAFTGLITAVTYSSGRATQFKIFVSEENPPVIAQVPLGSILTVNVTSSTRFAANAFGTNFTTLAFDASTVGSGQRVVVNGQLLSGTSAVTADARSIYLGAQPVLGNLSTTSPVVHTAENGKAGGFFMTPCSPLLQPQPIAILTGDNTNFVGISSLIDLTSNKPFLVSKGLVFYQQGAGTWNGVVWGAPATVQVAGQIHQLPVPSP